MIKKRLSLGHTNIKYLQNDQLIIVKQKNKFNHNLDYQQTQQFSFVPKLIEQKDDLIVWNYIENTKQLHDPSTQDLNDLAKIMSTIHQSKIKLPKNNLRKRVNAYLKTIHEKKIKDLDIENNYRFMIQLLANMRRNFPCHNDIWPDNVIKDQNNKLWIVDWEYATLGDPYFDLAYWITSSRLNEEQKTLFINYYFKFNQTFTFDQKVLKKYEKFCYWITLCWAYAQPGGPPFDLSFIKKTLK